MENGAKGCEVVISGKLRPASQSHEVQGWLPHLHRRTQEPLHRPRCSARSHASGVLGVRVKIMLAHDPEGKMGPKMAMPDNVIVHEPKEDPIIEIQPAEEAY